jgi:hypothetical protein
MGSPRIIEKFSFSALLKQLAFQIVTFFDAMLGPSVWLKVYYAFSQLSPFSIVVGAAVVLAIFRIRYIRRLDGRLVAGLAVMLFLAFIMFAMTGRYPQIAFNLGDRVTIYGSLLIAYLILAMPMPKLIRGLIIGLLMFSIIGISCHWKAWSRHQNVVIARIKKNADLQNYKDNRTLYVSGNQYSKYGPLSHIEFFSEGFVVGTVFNIEFGNRIQADVINRRFRYENGYLVDTKYGLKTKINGYVNVYDSEEDKLYKIGTAEINAYLEKLPADNRHWMQIVRVRFMDDVILRLMPRLKYAL